MTVKEFWHLKYGTIVEEVFYDGKIAWRGKVVKREVIDEWSGLIITKTKTQEIKTGRKILQITFSTGKSKYMKRYVDSGRIDVIKDLRISQEKELSPFGNYLR